jgi:hypothetical protein
LKPALLFLSLLFICGTIQACSSEEKDPDNIEFKEAIIDSNGHFLTELYDSIGNHIYDGEFDADQKIRVGPSTGYDANSFKLDSQGKVLSKTFLFNSTNWTRTYTYNNVDLRSKKYHILINNNPDLVARLSKENNKYGFVNSKGEWVIRPQWDMVKGFQANSPTSFVWNYSHPFSRWGIIDRKGHYLLKPTCVALRSFENTKRPIKICRIPFTFDGKQL